MMKYFLMMFVFASLIPFAYADIEFRGFDYKDIDHEDGTHTWIGGLPQWVFDVETGKYEPYIITNNSTHIILDNKQIPLSFDKSDCTITLYENIFNNVDFSDTIVSKEYWTVAYNVIGTSDWIELDALAIPCTFTATDNIDGLFLTVTRTAPQGEIVTYYKKEIGKEFKIDVEFTNNNPSWDNHRFRFIEKMEDISVDSFAVDVGNRIDDIRSQDRSVFFSWDEIPTKLVSFGKSNLQPFVINLQQNFDDFQGIQIDVIDGQFDFNLVYGRGQNFLLPGETMAIDPTFGYTSGTFTRIDAGPGQVGITCNTTYSKDTGNDNLFLRNSIESNDPTCAIVVWEWDTTSISDSATVTDTTVRYAISSVSNGRNCDWGDEPNQPSASSASTLWADAIGMTEYVNNDSGCTTTGTGKILDLGTTADSDVEALLSSDWFAISKKFDSMTRQTSTVNANFGGVEIQITYTVGASDPNDDIQQNGFWTFFTYDLYSLSGNMEDMYR